jgi:dTDP-4-amino-4,6-dideoxy-D-galactose acyltransferase
MTDSFAATKFRFLNWDSVHFGLRIGRVMPAAFDAGLSREARAWADAVSLDCMYLLADPDDATISRASESGWRMVDIRVTLAVDLSQLVHDASCVRPATTKDIPYLKHLARHSHRDSRFYADGNFPAADCDELFATWIERSVLDRDFAGAVFVPQVEGGRPTGYITCAIKKGKGDIGLIAIDEKTRGMGLGAQLLAEATRWFAERGTERVSVVTQGRNVPALRMYERYGFTIESTQHWFHWWREARDS